MNSTNLVVYSLGPWMGIAALTRFKKANIANPKRQHKEHWEVHPHRPSGQDWRGQKMADEAVCWPEQTNYQCWRVCWVVRLLQLCRCTLPGCQRQDQHDWVNAERLRHLATQNQKGGHRSLARYFHTDHQFVEPTLASWWLTNWKQRQVQKGAACADTEAFMWNWWASWKSDTWEIHQWS